MLTHIINTSLHTGTFPPAFKQARVSPLLKKNSLNLALLENYRPVSLLPFIAKTLERVVFNQLSLFLAQNNLLDNKQSGFKSGHSTETALLSITEALRLARAASKSSVLILLDLSAAFDSSTRSSHLPSERWASQEPHSCGSSLTSQIGPSGCLQGEATTSCYWGSSRLSAWTTSLLHLPVVIRISHSEAWFFLSLLC